MVKKLSFWGVYYGGLGQYVGEREAEHRDRRVTLKFIFEVALIKYVSLGILD